jgi:protein-S-isoprenylcysteine O-methyltransferase Ste14
VSDNLSERRPALPPTYFLSALGAAIILHFVVPLARFISFPWNLTGLLPAAAGIWLNLAADQSLKEEKTTVKPFEESGALVTSGAYRISRNPMYLGMVLIILGVAIFLGSLTPFAVVVILAVLLDRRFISVEEQMMSRTFSSDWQAYVKHVRKWI